MGQKCYLGVMEKTLSIIVLACALAFGTGTAHAAPATGCPTGSVVAGSQICADHCRGSDGHVTWRIVRIRHPYPDMVVDFPRCPKAFRIP